MTDDDVPGFLTALRIPDIVDAHVHFLPDNLQEAVWRWFDRLTPAWPVTYRSAAEDRRATLARLGVRHHTALAYPHRPGMLRSVNDHTLRLAEEVPAVIPTFTTFPSRAWPGDRALPYRRRAGCEGAPASRRVRCDRSHAR